MRCHKATCPKTFHPLLEILSHTGLARRGLEGRVRETLWPLPPRVAHRRGLAFPVPTLSSFKWNMEPWGTWCAQGGVTLESSRWQSPEQAPHCRGHRPHCRGQRSLLCPGTDSEQKLPFLPSTIREEAGQSADGHARESPTRPRPLVLSLRTPQSLVCITAQNNWFSTTIG